MVKFSNPFFYKNAKVAQLYRQEEGQTAEPIADLLKTKGGEILKESLSNLKKTASQPAVLQTGFPTSIFKAFYGQEDTPSFEEFRNFIYTIDGLEIKTKNLGTDIVCPAYNILEQHDFVTYENLGTHLKYTLTCSDLNSYESTSQGFVKNSMTNHKPRHTAEEMERHRTLESVSQVTKSARQMKKRKIDDRIRDDFS